MHMDLKVGMKVLEVETMEGWYQVPVVVVLDTLTPNTLFPQMN